MSVGESAVSDRRMNVRQAAFIGVGSMVGAGIFSLLGAAGEVAGAAVWMSFLIAGGIAILQGYSFSKFGARYPSAAGLLEYVKRGFGDGHITGTMAWLILMTNAIVTSMVAVSFGSYASEAVGDQTEGAVKLFAVLIVIVMSAMNVLGSQAVARVQTVIVYVVLTMLTIFAVSTLANLDPDLLAFSTYPSFGDIVASVALTFFAFLGFGVITFTAAELRDPARELSRAMYLALAIATTIYVAVALGVFGTLTVDEVIASGGTALAVAAEPTLGRAGFWMMTVTALFSTSGATNAGLYPAAGLCQQMADAGQFPPAPGPVRGGSGAGRAGDHGVDRDRAGGRIRPDRDRLDRKRHRPDRVHPDHRLALRRASRYGSQSDRARDRCRQHSHRADRVHVHNPGRRARNRSRPDRDRVDQRLRRPALETQPPTTQPPAGTCVNARTTPWGWCTGRHRRCNICSRRTASGNAISRTSCDSLHRPAQRR